MSVHQAVVDSLAALDVDPRDVALAVLCESYAARIDQASLIAAVADKALRMVDSDDEELREIVTVLRARLSEQQCLKDLGARLEAGLAQLHATAASRAKLPVSTAPTSGKLLSFRGTG